MAESKSMSGLNNKGLEKVDSVGEINIDNIKGTKKLIDRGAAKFWAKRGMSDATHAYKYGSKAAKSKNTD